MSNKKSIQMSHKRLNSDDIVFLLEILGFTKMKYEKTDYPTDKFKRQRISRMDLIEQKLKNLKDKISDKS